MAEEINSGNTSKFDWQAAVAAGGSVLGQLFAGRQARKAREWQEQMWNKQNEYNLPVNQVQRLKDAGINPNLAFGSAASTMSANIPSSPAYARYDFQEPINTYFRYKMEKASILSQIRERNAATRRTELENDFMDAVLQDKIQASLWGFRAGRARDEWMYKNNDEWFGSELSGKKFKNDLLRAEKSLYEARKSMTDASIARAWQDYNHLVKKYRFEDKYYGNYLNPYETSTAAGLFRTIFGGANSFGENAQGFSKSVTGGFKMFRDAIKEKRFRKTFNYLWNL